MKIQPMALQDIDSLYAIESLAHTHPWSKKIFSSNFGKRYFNQVAYDGDHLVGYFVANHVAGEATLLNIAISPEYQGKGFGKQLIGLFVEHCKSMAIEQIWLEVRESNQVARQVYQNAGFCELDIRSGYYPNEKGREDAIIMCLYLDAEDG